MELIPQIIIVDDDIDYSKQNAAFIETKCRIGCLPFGASVHDLIELKKAITEHPIKIIILDQKLNEDGSLRGTHLMPSLKEVNPNIQFIMLTGQVEDPNDLFLADDIGYAAKIRKNEWRDRMPDIIYKHIWKYDESIIKIIHHNKVLKSGFTKSWILLNQEVINEEYVDEKNWKSLVRIDRGKEKEETVETKLSINNELIITSERTLDVGLQDKLKSFFNKSISVKGTRGLKKVFQTSKTMSIKTSEKLSLEQNEEFEDKKVVAKEYQENQLYKQVLIHVAVICRFCKHEDIIPIFVFIPLSKKRCRQVIHTEDDVKHYVDTGYEDIKTE